MVYYSLTEAPHNLKEGIDWLMALKGTDAESNIAALGAAVHKFLADKPVGSMKLPALEEVKLITKEFLKRPALRAMWPAQSVLRRFNDVINKEPGVLCRWFGDAFDSDYKNVIKSKRLTAQTITKQLSEAVNGCEKLLEGIKNPENYESSYSSEATWEKSCSEKPEACAVVLVGIAPMLYVGLRSMKVACDTERLGGVPGAMAMSSLGSVLLAVGYEEKLWRAKLATSHVTKALKDVSYKVLVTLYDLAGFWAFFGSKNAAGKSGELDEEAQRRIDFYVNMKPITPPKKYVFRKPPSTYTATGSNNMYYPWLPTVLDMGDTIPL